MDTYGRQDDQSFARFRGPQRAAEPSIQSRRAGHRIDSTTTHLIHVLAHTQRRKVRAHIHAVALSLPTDCTWGMQTASSFGKETRCAKTRSIAFCFLGSPPVHRYIQYRYALLFCYILLLTYHVLAFRLLVPVLLTRNHREATRRRRAAGKRD